MYFLAGSSLGILSGIKDIQKMNCILYETF